VKVVAKIPSVFKFLRKKARYKVAHGGRGSSKSWSFARQLILRLTESPQRWLCCREIQNSIEESVHKLIQDQIYALGLESLWQIDKTSIRCKNGSEFIFKGLFRNVDAIRSMERLDGAWIEEAHNVSEESFNQLTPTIRAPGSEIWISFNPKYPDDFIYSRFVATTPPDAIVQQVNFDDNPYFPEVLRAEMEYDKETDRMLYRHKWLGEPVGAGQKIWPNFKNDVHIKTFDRARMAKEAACYMTMDPHSHYYPFCQWLAVIPKNSRGNWPEDFYRHVYAEWPTTEILGGPYHELRKKLLYKGSLADIAREIYGRDGTEYGIKVKRRFIDSRYAKGAGAWSWSTATVGMVELFAREENGGLKFDTPSEKLMDAQRQVINEDMLWNKHQPINKFNEPTFSVDPSCKNTILSLQNHRLEEIDSTKRGEPREAEKYKEASDTLRIAYAGLHEVGFEAPGDGSEPAKKLDQYYRASAGSGWR